MSNESERQHNIYLSIAANAFDSCVRDVRCQWSGFGVFELFGKWRNNLLGVGKCHLLWYAWTWRDTDVKWIAVSSRVSGSKWWNSWSAKTRLKKRINVCIRLLEVEERKDPSSVQQIFKSSAIILPTVCICWSFFSDLGRW